MKKFYKLGADVIILHLNLADELVDCKQRSRPMKFTLHLFMRKPASENVDYITFGSRGYSRHG